MTFSANKDQQEMCAVAEKLHDAVVKFDKYRNLQWHRAVLSAIAWHPASFERKRIGPLLLFGQSNCFRLTAKVPRHFRSQERKFHIIFAPGRKSSTYRT